MFEKFKVFETTVAGRPLVIETGKMAQLAGGSCMVRYGETNVLCTATMSDKPREGVDFFPLSVDFEEKLYSVGKIPGSFQRREGRASEKATLASRVIDRPIRPLFPKDMRNDVGVVATVMSVDPDCLPEIAAMWGVSVALSISSIPWDGPVSSVSLGLIDGQYIINPTAQQREISEMAVTVASTANLVAMIEASANEISNDVMFDGIMFAHEENKKIVEFINGIRQEIGEEKIDFPSNDPSSRLYEAVEAFAQESVEAALNTDDKRIRDERLKPIYEAVHNEFDEKFPEEVGKIDDCLYKLQKNIVRRRLLDEGKRVDGRGINDLRPLDAQIDLLSRVHGSGMFTRGQTQVLTVTTLGTARDAQLLDGIDQEEEKRYIHHYNFPSYSVGETKPARGPGRREIGHGALAERALAPVIPSEEEFPYTIRLVSEVLQANASTSMAAVCGSTLALMDAGVPIKAPVAGISIGLIDCCDDYRLLVDMEAIEDFMGGMDLKIAGTRSGVNCIQMDTKTQGVSLDILADGLRQAHSARLQVLDVMAEAIPYPRQELSRYAPRMLSLIIQKEQIGLVIGPGGKNIRRLQDTYEVNIDIEDDGTVLIFGTNAEGVEAARNAINDLTRIVEVGEVFEGEVVSTTDFGAFVEVLPGREGLVHISHLAWEHVKSTQDVVKPGDRIQVKVIEVDSEGKIRLSRKELLPKPANYVPETGGRGGGDRGGRPRPGGGGGGSRPSGGHRPPSDAGAGAGAGGGGGDEEGGRPKPYFRKKRS